MKRSKEREKALEILQMFCVFDIEAILHHGMTTTLRNAKEKANNCLTLMLEYADPNNINFLNKVKDEIKKIR